MCREAMFNWNQRLKQIAETKANPSLPNGNEIGTQSPSARIVAKLEQKGPMLQKPCFTKSNKRWCLHFCEFVI